MTARSGYLLQDYVCGRLDCKQAIIMRALISSPEFVSHGRLHDLLWGHDPSGGPEDAQHTVGVHVCRLRWKLRPGLSITNLWGRGYRLVRAERRAA